MEWAYMATLSFLMGFACLAPFRKKGGCQIHSAVTYMMAGLLVLNVYAEYFSLFAGIGFFQNFENTGMPEKNGKKRRRA